MLTKTIITPSIPRSLLLLVYPRWEGKVINLQGMFEECEGLESVKIDLPIVKDWEHLTHETTMLNVHNIPLYQLQLRIAQACEALTMLYKLREGPYKAKLVGRYRDTLNRLKKAFRVRSRAIGFDNGGIPLSRVRAIRKVLENDLSFYQFLVDCGELEYYNEATVIDWVTSAKESKG